MTNHDRAALVVFAKTPGRTPAKTRLAADVGTETAEAFYRASLAATAAVADAAAAHGLLDVIWAVAEPDAVDDPFWAGRRTVGQGTGGLGERLHTVYSSLIAERPAVLLIGCDSPHHTPERLLRPAAALLDDREPADFRLGRCTDGGYWLLGGRRPIPRSAFLSVSYSAAVTAVQTAAALAPLGGVAEEPVSFDVDAAADLRRLRAALKALTEPLTEQLELLASLPRGESRAAEAGR
ncbi:TIGR04282 family arsenosugar biosynthesis glycosyltransferase [Alienimonas californiensis]|uniref:2-phospho-L-lactate guanylyltransferase n=1 Tax=Alienimonas californiensis TaxID=2527989 RepID=A0A517PEG3_9PLAN|nr:DUF2064 domain-containing protein [Alienimonas californiensis]QDT17766.1 hypothetical protein CA12_38980 [Alienimonas californiensis]